MKRCSRKVDCVIAILCIAVLCYGICYYFLVETIDDGYGTLPEFLMKKVRLEEFLQKFNDFRTRFPSSSCGRFPKREDLNISDTHWHVTNTTNGTFYLFNAYLDDRAALNNESVVRFLGMINVLRPTVKTYCQMWFVGLLEPISVEVYEYHSLWPTAFGDNTIGATPNLISCKNPLAHRGLVPSHVSLVERQCDDANNIFPVSNKRPVNGKKKLFLVCLREMNFDEDISLMLIEWAEILKAFGVDNVVAYVQKVHPNTMKVLHHYEQTGFFILRYITFPHDLPNELAQSQGQWLQNQVISYHDALYEHCYMYEFLVPIDMDEFILPLVDEDRTWSDLITRMERKRFNDQIIDAFPVPCMYFLLKSVHENETIDGIPKNLRFLSNIYRAAKFLPNGGGQKVFLRMDRVFNLHNHFPVSCLNPQYCNQLVVDDAQLSHYRDDCELPECREAKPNPVEDKRLWKYKDEVMANMIKTLDILRDDIFESPEIDLA